MTTKSLVAIVVAVVTAAMLGYVLGQQEGREPSLINPDMPIAKGTPLCEAVWQTGRRLPDDYQGCKNQAGDFVGAMHADCQGAQVIVFNQHGHWYAAPNGRVEATEGRPCGVEPQ